MSLENFTLSPIVEQLVQRVGQRNTSLRLFKVHLNMATMQFDLFGSWFPVINTWDVDYQQLVEVGLSNHSKPCFIIFRMDTVNDYGFHDWAFIFYAPSIAMTYEQAVLQMFMTKVQGTLGCHLQPSFIYQVRYIEMLAFSHFKQWIINQQLKMFDIGYGNFRFNPNGFLPEVFQAIYGTKYRPFVNLKMLFEQMPY